MMTTDSHPTPELDQLKAALAEYGAELRARLAHPSRPALTDDQLLGVTRALLATEEYVAELDGLPYAVTDGVWTWGESC